jgi:cell division protein FtsW
VRNREPKLSKQKRSIDKKLLILIIAFVVIGLLAVADASAPQAINSYGDKFFLLKQQVEWAAVGLVVLFITSKIKYTFWEKIATPLFTFFAHRSFAPFWFFCPGSQEVDSLRPH